MTKNKLICCALPMLLACAALKGSMPSITLEELTHQATALDGKTIRVTGFLKEGIGGYFLYKNYSAVQDETYAGGIDVLLNDGVQKPELGQANKEHCVEVQGVFTAFSEDKLGIGYFRSLVGYIEVSRILDSTRCNQ